MRGSEYLESKLKSTLDYSVASGALPVTSPFWLAMYCYNRLRKEPLLFQQERIGLFSQPFMVFKFETLFSRAELIQEQDDCFHKKQSERESTDSRVPNKAMSIMRKTGFNEIPQIINVLKGEMSIVGPRPLPKCFLTEAGEFFPEIMKEWRDTALRCKPGIVGVSPLKTRRLPIQQFNEIAIADIQYYQQATFWKDISVMAEAFVAIVRGK
jgi:lipopolysaccharide/colanic/teichoic acid biosynthesis glycosyltransferase